MNNFGLPENTLFQIKNYLSQIEEIEAIKIFGSRVKGTYKKGSDIDIALFGENLTDKLLKHISNELDELPTPYKFDVIDYKTIENENLKSEIDRYGIVL